ncbi:MAG: GMC family oxidoreductase [Leptonema sp. (in: Bacteria)]|nr:GMC family oxidoreductase [Leptonema sp. (in: bacteria)]
MNNEIYDVVIIGSGAGGGTVAEYLSRVSNHNLKILILERGPYWPKENFTQREIEMSKIYFNRGAVLTADRSLALSAARTVGGSTAVYTGVSFRPPSHVLADWRSNYGLSFLTDEYANKVLDGIEEQIGVHQLPESMDNDNNLLFKEGCEKLGITPKRLRVNTRHCDGQGFCNLGCTKGAKQGTLEVQIPLAVKNGAKLVWNAYVHEIEPGDTVKLHVQINEAWPFTKPNVWPEGSYTVQAKKVVIAGGSYQSPALLHRSKKLKLNRDIVGRYITLHPAYNINGIHTKELVNYRGFPKSFYVDDFGDSDHYLLETSFYYPGVTAKNNPGFGADHQSLMDDYQKMMSILILGHDAADYKNRITIDKKTGEPIVNYKVSDKVKLALVKALRKSAEIFFAAGCQKVALPSSKKPVLTVDDQSKLNQLIDIPYLDFLKAPLSSAHPQGGARMSADDKQAVVSPSGHLFEHKNIFVADASLFPDSVKVNPYETVMLLANYVAKQVVAV